LFLYFKSFFKKIKSFNFFIYFNYYFLLFLNYFNVKNIFKNKKYIFNQKYFKKPPNQTKATFQCAWKYIFSLSPFWLAIQRVIDCGPAICGLPKWTKDGKMQLVAFSFSCKVPHHTIRWRIVSLNSELPLSGRVSQLWTALELEGWTHVKDTMLPLRNWVRSYGVEEDNQNIYEFESLPSIFPMIAWNACRVHHVLVFRTNV